MAAALCSSTTCLSGGYPATPTWRRFGTPWSWSIYSTCHHTHHPSLPAKSPGAGQQAGACTQRMCPVATPEAVLHRGSEQQRPQHWLQIFDGGKKGPWWTRRAGAGACWRGAGDEEEAGSLFPFNLWTNLIPRYCALVPVSLISSVVGWVWFFVSWHAGWFAVLI